MADLPSSQQRDVVKNISPPWLCTGVNERYMYNLGLSSDILLEKMNQSSKAHLPGLGTPTALPYIGLDKIIQRGSLDTYATYVIRLSRAYDTWQFAGTRQGVMSQALYYLESLYGDFDPGIYTPRMMVVGQSTDGVDVYTNWATYTIQSEIDGPPDFVRVTNGNNWAWDNQVLWWRNWMILYFPQDGTPVVSPEETWGNGTWGEANGSWGLNVEPTVWPPLRNLMRLWKSGNTWYQWIIINFIGSWFIPTETSGSGNPTNDYGRNGITIDGVYQRARSENARYVNGTSFYYPDCTVPSGM